MRLSPYSPEARRRRAAKLAAQIGIDEEKRRHVQHTAWEVIKRVANGVWSDGFIHAGNLAFLSLMALFPFIILTSAVTNLLGKSQDAQLAVFNILRRMPPGVANTLRDPIQQVLEARTGPLLWLGAIVGLWTAASFVETIRDILRRAYGVRYSAPFWTYRLWSILIIVVAVFMMIIAFAVSVFLSSMHHLVIEWFPYARTFASTLGLYRAVPGVMLFATIYILFVALTPGRYRKRGCYKWPGALMVAAWWLITAAALPIVIQWFGGYDITYGSLAGVMVALIFFFLVGLGVVVGAELNAALADGGARRLEGEQYDGPFNQTLESDRPDVEEELDYYEYELERGTGS